MNNNPLTQLEFDDEDMALAEDAAKRLGYKQTAYTSTSALVGLGCLAENDRHKPGFFIKTKELGLLFIQDFEDLKMCDLYEKQLDNQLAKNKR